MMETVTKELFKLQRAGDSGSPVSELFVKITPEPQGEQQ